MSAPISIRLREAIACRDCAASLLITARSYKARNNAAEVKRLVTKLRWYWQRYVREMREIEQ